MDGSNREPARRTLTPAVLASGAFVAICAVIAITFVAARGGLQMPVAPGGSAVAIASPLPSLVPTAPQSTQPGPTAAVSPAASSGVPSLAPSIAPTAPPTAVPEPSPSGTSDPLTALPSCPGIAGCYEYRIKRDDALSAVASRYAIPVSTVLALNPQISDPGTIVVGQILYLGRQPYLRLEPCPDGIGCFLYEVRAGDRLSTIAGRYGLTVQGILDANPSIDDPNSIHTGQVIRLLYNEL